MKDIYSNRQLKKYNKTRILQYIYQNRQVSRTDIYKALELSPASVTLLIEELMQEGYVIETSEAQSTGGRKPILLSVDRSSAWVIVLELLDNGIRHCIMDLYGEPTQSQFTQFSPEKIAMDFFSCIQQVLNHVLAAPFLEDKQVAGIGIVTNSVTEELCKSVVVESNFETVVIDLKSAIEMHYYLPVFMESALVSSAVAYCARHGKAVNGKVMYIEFNSHIEAVMIGKKSLLEQKISPIHGFAHMIVDIQGEKCVCGMKGCLDTYASIPALYSKMHPGEHIAEPSAMLTYANSHMEQHGELFAKMLRYLLCAIYNAALVTRVENVVIGGVVGGSPWFHKLFKAYADMELVKKLNIVLEKGGNPGQGTARLVIDQYLNLVNA